MFRLFKKKKPRDEFISEELAKEKIEEKVEGRIEELAEEKTIEKISDNIGSAIDLSTDTHLNADEIQILESSATEGVSESIETQEKSATSSSTSNSPADDSSASSSPASTSSVKVEVTLASKSTEQKNETTTPVPKAISEAEPTEKKGLLQRLTSGLAKTSNTLTEGMNSFVLGKKKIDDDVLEELETRLLMADVGMEATQRIINNLIQRSSRNELNNADALITALHEEMLNILRPVSKPLDLKSIDGPAVILMVGINGAGKTTTIGKLAKQFQNDGMSVMLAAGDTFRAAAVEQLQVWGERNNIPVVAQGTGADSASVIYDAMESAKAKNIDILLADTAGRLHTQTNLMEELKKIKRVIQKINPDAPHEVMLVVDASIGQNALAQAKEFNATLGLTGITVTKLDGTAKGGILFAMAEKTAIPVRFIGVGESIDDLQAFDATAFTNALLTKP